MFESRHSDERKVLMQMLLQDFFALTTSQAKCIAFSTKSHSCKLACIRIRVFVEMKMLASSFGECTTSRSEASRGKGVIVAWMRSSRKGNQWLRHTARAQRMSIAHSLFYNNEPSGKQSFER